MAVHRRTMCLPASGARGVNESASRNPPGIRCPQQREMFPKRRFRSMRQAKTGKLQSGNAEDVALLRPVMAFRRGTEFPPGMVDRPPLPNKRLRPSRQMASRAVRQGRPTGRIPSAGAGASRRARPVCRASPTCSEISVHLSSQARCQASVPAERLRQGVRAAIGATMHAAAAGNRLRPVTRDAGRRTAPNRSLRRLILVQTIAGC